MVPKGITAECMNAMIENTFNTYQNDVHLFKVKKEHPYG